MRASVTDWMTEWEESGRERTEREKESEFAESEKKDRRENEKEDKHKRPHRSVTVTREGERGKDGNTHEQESVPVKRKRVEGSPLARAVGVSVEERRPHEQNKRATQLSASGERELCVMIPEVKKRKPRIVERKEKKAERLREQTHPTVL